VTNKFINFNVESAEIIKEDPDSQFAVAKIRAFSSGENLHELVCSEDVLKKTASTIYNKPILYTFDNVLDDFYTHVEADKNLIAGFTVPDSGEFERLDDGRLSLNIFARIWKRYAPRVVELFKRDSNSKKVSVEMELLDSSERPDGLSDMLDFVYAGITILGDYITEASPGANMTLLSFSEENEKLKNAYKEEFGKYFIVDFRIPSKVKENAKTALDTYKKGNNGASTFSLGIAQYLIDHNEITPDQVYKIAGRKIKNNNIDNNFYGGIEGYEWAKNIENLMAQIDSKEFSTKGGEFMPYTTKEDMNPALKGIKPPISVAQANEIAKEADAIGSDKSKNGWAIAIGNFKKNHVAKDGRWVAKEKKMGKDFAKEDLGKGEAVTVDKSKDSMSTSPWGNVDKTALMHKVLGAKNYKSLASDVYMKVDAGWEDKPSEGLHYPVMQITGNKAVYNRYGLSQALLRARAQGENGVVSKVEGIYSKMGLEKPDNEKMALEDEEDMAAQDDENQEDMAASDNQDNGDDSANGGGNDDDQEDMAAKASDDEKDENPEEEKTETPDQEKAENDKEKMSLNAYLDVATALAMLDKETENYEQVVSEFSKPMNEMNWGLMMGAMFDAMKKMDAKAKSYMAENDALKKFKTDAEKSEFQFAVDAALKDIENRVTIPTDVLDELRQESGKYSLKTLDTWKNIVKAKAFDFSAKENDGDGNEIKRFDLPFSRELSAGNGSPWKR
jgi:hypothetical protein